MRFAKFSHVEHSDPRCGSGGLMWRMMFLGFANSSAGTAAFLGESTGLGSLSACSDGLNGVDLSASSS